MAETQRRAALGLYRTILDLHRRKLPFDMRVLGNQYVREEFHLHKKAQGSQLRMFMDEWRQYADVLRSQAEVTGKDMGEDVRQALSQEQKVQLNKLKEEARSFAKDEDESYKL